MPYLLETINDRIRSDPAGFVAECEAVHGKKIQDAARAIAEHRKESRIILLSGPSGSGKTTTALKIEKELERIGIETHTISMDNYFNTIDPDTAPRNRDGEIDFESPFCLDIDLLNRHFSMLDRGELIHIPKYEFARQIRSDILSQPLRLGPDEMAIFEGIHALNDIIVGKNLRAFKLYIAARSNIINIDGKVIFQHPWLRLCRRIVRDSNFRGSAPELTMKMWPNVQRGEKLYISPYKENADLKFDTSLAYEVPALKSHLVGRLKRVDQEDFPMVRDLLAALEQFESIDDDLLPEDSMIREFIGGSIFDY